MFVLFSRASAECLQRVKGRVRHREGGRYSICTPALGMAICSYWICIIIVETLLALTLFYLPLPGFALIKLRMQLNMPFSTRCSRSGNHNSSNNDRVMTLGSVLRLS